MRATVRAVRATARGKTATRRAERAVPERFDWQEARDALEGFDGEEVPLDFQPIGSRDPRPRSAAKRR